MKKLFLLILAYFDNGRYDIYYNGTYLWGDLTKFAALATIESKGYLHPDHIEIRRIK